MVVLRDHSRRLLQLQIRRPSEIFGKCEIQMRKLITASQTGYLPPHDHLFTKSVIYFCPDSKSK